MKGYQGTRGPGGCIVMVHEHPDGGTVLSRRLDPRYDLRNHSPDGFEWGYGGSGPAQLALALLADATGDDALALRIYQEFKNRIVCRIDNNPWTLTQVAILDVVATILEDEKRAPAGEKVH